LGARRQRSSGKVEVEVEGKVKVEVEDAGAEWNMVAPKV
jgi:hypothetical protein